MPEITDYQIHSFSSEDSNFPAKNLMSNSTTKKWKCGNVDDTSSFVILRLSEPKVICALNIGNEGSAFIEVLVADSKDNSSDFIELILATSFMTPMESMNERSMNRVKCFPSNSLVESTMTKKWDLVKIVCKQPFNKKLKYGIAFVSLQTPALSKPKKTESTESDDEQNMQEKVTEIKKSPKSSEKKIKKFGRFTMRLDSSDEDDDDMKISPFARWKSKTEDKKENGLKRVIESKLSEDRSSKKIKIDENSAHKSRQRSKLMYESEDDAPNEKVEQKIKKDQIVKEKSEKPKISVPSSSKSSSESKFSIFTSSENEDKKSPRKSFHSSSQKPKKKIEYKKFEKLLEGVTFAFSGYQNPERGILRDKMLEMGAKYQPDWNDKCSHLICAFKNTPKYNQVKVIKGKKIVTKKWIEACHSERKRIPWRRFALDKAEMSGSESENEVHCKDETVENLKSLKAEEKSRPTEEKTFVDISTDEDDSNMSKNQCENKLFKGKTFYLNRDLSATDKIKLKDQIESMSGKVCNTSHDADYVIASTSNQLPNDVKGECLKSLWVNEVYELEAVIPVTRYKLKE